MPRALPAQPPPGAPRLLVAHRGGGVAPASDDVPRADRELVQAAIGAAATDGARVVARLAPAQVPQILLAPARTRPPHLELEHGVAAAPGRTRETSPATLHPVDGAAQLATRGRPGAAVRRADAGQQVTADVQVVTLQAPAPAQVARAEALGPLLRRRGVRLGEAEAGAGGSGRPREHQRRRERSGADNEQYGGSQPGAHAPKARSSRLG